jgi:hypothetical protein
LRFNINIQDHSTVLHQTIEDELQVKASRKNTAKLFLKPLALKWNNRPLNNETKKDNNPFSFGLNQQEIVPPPKEGLSNNALVAAFILSASVLVLRFGGRSALVQMLGLDFFSSDLGLKQNVSDFVNYFHNLGGIFI